MNQLRMLAPTEFLPPAVAEFLRRCPEGRGGGEVIGSPFYDMLHDRSLLDYIVWVPRSRWRQADLRAGRPRLVLDCRQQTILQVPVPGPQASAREVLRMAHALRASLAGVLQRIRSDDDTLDAIRLRRAPGQVMAWSAELDRSGGGFRRFVPTYRINLIVFPSRDSSAIIDIQAGLMGPLAHVRNAYRSGCGSELRFQQMRPVERTCGQGGTTLGADDEIARPRDRPSFVDYRRDDEAKLMEMLHSTAPPLPAADDSPDAGIPEPDPDPIDEDES